MVTKKQKKWTPVFSPELISALPSDFHKEGEKIKEIYLYVQGHATYLLDGMAIDDVGDSYHLFLKRRIYDLGMDEGSYLNEIQNQKGKTKDFWLSYFCWTVLRETMSAHRALAGC